MRKFTDDCSYEESVFPEAAMGPFLPVTDHDVDVFNDILSDEVESSFTSSMCCRDVCYDNFKEYWPDVAFRDTAFQSQSVELLWLIESSRMGDLYSSAEISTLRRLVICPRCADPVPHNIWIYEHRFSDAAEIEDAIDELTILGARTPFLLLEHPFAQRVLAQIRELASTAKEIPLAACLYRARLTESILEQGQSPGALASYAPPPAAYASEGRFNHAGTPMLYLASSPATAAAEIGKPGVSCHVATLRLLRPQRDLDLVEIDEDAPGFELMSALACSALLSAPRTDTGWVRRQYIFSRFVADCARSAGFDAIRYGSVLSS